MNFKAGRCGDVNPVAPAAAAQGRDNIRQDFGNDKPVKISRTKSFVEEQSALNCSEADADKCAIFHKLRNTG